MSDEINLQAECTDRSRLAISEDFKESMKGAAKVAIVALGVAAQATQNVPYLGAISTALTEFMKMQDEVDECKDECRAAIADAQTLQTLVEKFRDKCVQSGKGEGILDVSLRETFTELESVVLECITVLQKCKVDSKRKRDRLRLYFQRSVLSKSVKDCSAKMAKALQRFNTTLQVDQVILLEDIRTAFDELRGARSPETPQVATSHISSAWQLRAAPPIFYGREAEIGHALDLILHQAPARVAVLGSGGIGKTSIALTILHHPDVEALYGAQRCFVSCEAMTTADDVVRSLAEAVDLYIESRTSSESALHRLVSYLKSVTGIVCIDNLETPWDADTAAVERLLAEIASGTPSLALLITSRVTDTPLIGWSHPSLKPIAPFSIEAALQTWDAACFGHDEYAVKVIEAVDRVPLAVTLLARLGRTETAKTIWSRWELERTDLIQSRGVSHRLNNIGVSIELSLHALGSRDAIDVLSMICVLDGIAGPRLSMIDESLKDRISFTRAIALLRQYSLVYAVEDTGCLEPEYICVLSPIREHVQKYHPLSDELLLALLEIMVQSGLRWRWDPILKNGVNRGGPCRERCLDIVISSPHRTRDIEVHSAAIKKAQSLDPHIQLRILRAPAVVSVITRTGYDKALFFLSKAIELDKQIGDRRALFLDWVEWIQLSLDATQDRVEECKLLEEVQDVIQQTWAVGRDKDQVWRLGYYDYVNLASAQNRVNARRRTWHMPVVHRSGLYADNNSTEDLSSVLTYDQLIETSAPPWDLSLILEVPGVKVAPRFGLFDPNYYYSSRERTRPVH